MTITRPRKQLPQAVQAHLDGFADPRDLRDYLRSQRQHYDDLEFKPCSFVGWLQLKLSCSRDEARTMYHWASGEKI